MRVPFSQHPHQHLLFVLHSTPFKKKEKCIKYGKNFFFSKGPEKEGKCGFLENVRFQQVHIYTIIYSIHNTYSFINLSSNSNNKQIETSEVITYNN